MSVLSRNSGRLVRVAIAATMMGCGTDLGVAPRSDEASRASPTLARRGHMEGDTLTSSILVTPNQGGVFWVGSEHVIAIEEGAICDPQKSSYGPTEWDAECVPMRRSITITARSWYDAGGHPRVRFSPDLRFVPTKTVTLYLADQAAVLDPSYKIFYCISNTDCVDESLTDPSLATQRDPNGRFLFRRIKHFSGFNVAADRY